MALIGQRSLKMLFEFNKNFWAEVSRDPGIPQTVKSMIYQHIQSLWVPDALAVVISPLSGGANNPYLKQSAFDLGGLQYYYPSLEFWKAHASTSHPPDGQGCDPAAHAAFLTPSGQNAEFTYAIVKRDGTIVAQELDDFVTECAYFDSGMNE